MAKVEKREYLGRGLTLPFGINSRGDFKNASGIDNLRSAVELLLGTRKGELRWDPDFGLELDKLLYGPMTEDLSAEAEAVISEGFLREPRVQIVSVQANLITRTGELQLNVDWAIRGQVEVDGQVEFSSTVTLPQAV